MATQSNPELQGTPDVIKSFTEASDKPSGYMNCPHCGKRFNIKDVKQMQEQRKALMLQTLIGQGFSLREIGKLFNMHPQSVKYWSEKFQADTKGSDLRLDDPEATTTATNTSPKPHHHKER